MVLVSEALHTHLQKLRQGGCEGAQKHTRIAAMVVAEEAKN
jgi:hypothetical protein